MQFACHVNKTWCEVQMADGAAELQEAVVRLCSLWWQKELPGRDNMVPQMIPYLLYQATVSGTLLIMASCIMSMTCGGCSLPPVQGLPNTPNSWMPCLFGVNFHVLPCPELVMMG